ncbi:tetratricopeptide (TPR) repeat protein [Micromonospora sp. HB375]|uniref:ATP-binding protein n=1 Tax=unclassified Micromonospora TaxID=2617518 RepID=UPI001AE6A371|nr:MULTISPECIES: ATP-binding protein [unclassified Micromonospora]MBP1783194.1 tetratricopeptide (TPR) repeat protein [Micromonospora sp. HB375]MDH6468065.1 tetratricopeptide (TPR) repeat protein [Micromonospora sp. H404/HB375]
MSDAIAQAVRQKNISLAVRLMFDRDFNIRWGYHREGELWDYKSDCPPRRGRDAENAWANIASDVLGFHNQQGGLLFFGIDDKSFKFVGATSLLDSKTFNDQLRRFLPDNIFVEYSREFIQTDQRYLGVALIPPRGPVPARFRSGAPMINGKRKFEKGGTSLRNGDSTNVMSPTAADEWIQSLRVPVVGNTLAVDIPQFRILMPEYEEFIERTAVGREVERSLRDPRTAVTSLVGVGGMGKTALATWAVLKAYDSKEFNYIVSMTAKDRELTATGIVGLSNRLTSYERLLDEIADVLQFPDLHELPVKEKEEQVKLLLASDKGLVYVDNLETVDDARIIRFLDNLPLGVKGIVTSRRSRVRVAVRPVDVHQMTDKEVVSFVMMLAKQPTFKHIGQITASEALRVGSAWNGIPLAIRWAFARSSSVAEAISSADAARTIGRHGEELLEFSFRRVFDNLTPVERSVLQILGVLQQAIPIEAIAACTSYGSSDVIDSLDDLVNDSLAVREFDTARNDYCYTLLPITRAFVQSDVRSDAGLAASLHRQLRNWFEALDVKSTDERLIVRELRQGNAADDAALVDLAIAAQREGRNDSAEKLFQQALQRTPRSWRAARLYGEFLRHRRGDLTGAIRMYTQAAANAPARGADRSLIFREYGILLKDSGEPDATDKATTALREAVSEAPNDLIAATALSTVLDRKGAYREIISILEPRRESDDPKFRNIALPILLRAYNATNEILKAAQLKQLIAEQNADS